MDAPSPGLKSLLDELQLVSPSQWRRARSAMRAFLVDLPAFDSVWLDGLVQVGALTPFQADWIARGDGSRLSIGDYVLYEPLVAGRLMSTYLAQRKSSGERAQLAHWKVSEDRASDQELHARLSAFETLSRQSVSSGLTNLTLPRELILDPQFPRDLWAVSPYTPGVTAQSLMIRRGRFPHEVVQGLIAEIAHSLQSVEMPPLWHGDLRLDNLLLSNTGQVKLLNHGLLAAVLPVISIHDQVPLELLDGLAPERLEPPGTVTENSEMYALGCLAWQLLAGRPPFPTADPLVKRQAHRTRRIPDIREFAPETPPALAELILQLTEPLPQKRPNSFAAVETQCRMTRSQAQTRIARFTQEFESASPRPWVSTTLFQETPVNLAPGPSRWSLVAGTMLALGLGIAGHKAWMEGAFAPLMAAFPDSLRSAPPELPTELPSSGDSPGSARSSTSAPLTQADRQLIPEAPLLQTAKLEVSSETLGSGTLPAVLELPAPNAEGVVDLLPGQVYAGRSLSARELLWIRGPVQRPATILLTPLPFTLSASTVRLQGVKFRSESAESPPQNSAIVVQASHLEIEECRFLGTISSPEDSVVIDWTEPAPGVKPFGKLQVHDTAFLGGGSAIRLRGPFLGALFDNVLKTGSGPLLELTQGVAAGYSVNLVCERVTLRNSGPLVATALSPERPGELVLDGTDCAFAPQRDQPLVLIADELLSPDWSTRVKIAARGLVLREGSQLLGFQGTAPHPTARVTTPLETADVRVDGLLIGKFQFSGSDLSEPLDCTAIVEQVPLHLGGLPFGAVLDSFPSP